MFKRPNQNGAHADKESSQRQRPCGPPNPFIIFRHKVVDAKANAPLANVIDVFHTEIAFFGWSKLQKKYETASLSVRAFVTVNVEVASAIVEARERQMVRGHQRDQPAGAELTPNFIVRDAQATS
jgi:hypothetical protein